MRNDPDIHYELLKEKPFGEYSKSNLLDLTNRLISDKPLENKYLIEPLSYIWGNLKGTHRTEFNQKMPKDLLPIRWLPKVKNYLHSIKFHSTPRGQGHVYFIPVKLNKFVSIGHQTKQYGVYIGSSKWSPEKRLSQHLEGGHLANREVCKYSYQFYLVSLSHIFGPISRMEADRIELHCLKYLREDANFKNLPKKIILGDNTDQKLTDEDLSGS